MQYIHRPGGGGDKKLLTGKAEITASGRIDEYFQTQEAEYRIILLQTYRYWAERGLPHTVVADALDFYVAAFLAAVEKSR